jgi:hypothetical protein
MAEVLRAHSYSSTTTWRTADELTFLDQIGEHRENRYTLRASDKIQLLRSYLKGFELRRVWRNLEPEVIRRRAESLIRSYTGLSKTKGS